MSDYQGIGLSIITFLPKSSQQYNELDYLLWLLPNLPITWRSFVVTLSRVQQDPFRNQRLLEIWQNLPSHQFSDTRYLSITPYRFVAMLSCYYDNPPIMALLSYLARGEVFHDSFEPNEIIQSQIEKELSASSLPDVPQQLHYGVLSQTIERPLSAYHMLNPGFHQFFSNQLDAWLDNLQNRREVILPLFQSRKNMGYRTQELLEPFQEGRALTTGDLEYHYHLTGEKISGPCEMRYAWKYGDLKPRVYYAQGGDCYFPSRYMRDIARSLCELLPATSVNTRYNVFRITNPPLEPGEAVITYDYSSFTTALAELKYFIAYLAFRCKGTTVKVLDTHIGILELDLGDLLWDYNVAVNINPQFDVSRLAGYSEIRTQSRSGMLGVQGNIAFSTFLHGLSLSNLVGEDVPVSVVGDDALARVHVEDIPRIDLGVNLLGEVHPQKPHEWYYESMYYEGYEGDDGWQYLKLPLDVNMLGELEQGNLPHYPNLALILVPHEKVRRCPDTANERLYTFLTQVGRYLTVMYNNIDIYDLDAIELSLAGLRCCYHKMRIPTRGSLPGLSKAHLFGTVIDVKSFIPPVDSVHDVEVHWVEVLFKQTPLTRFLYPNFSDIRIMPPLAEGVGSTFRCTPHRMQRIMTNFGYMEMEQEVVNWEVNEETSAKFVDLFCGRTRPVGIFHIIQDLPVWYNDYMIEMEKNLSGGERLTRISLMTLDRLYNIPLSPQLLPLDSEGSDEMNDTLTEWVL